MTDPSQNPFGEGNVPEEGTPERDMPRGYSSVRGELLGAGYRLLRSELCPKCQRQLDVFESTEGREQQYNGMEDPISPGGLHQLTCRESVPDYRLPPIPDQWAMIAEAKRKAE